MRKPIKRLKPKKYAYWADDLFAPAHTDKINLILRQGCSKDELADLLLVPLSQLELWEAAYPSLKKAIEEGMTSLDEDVVVSTYKAAVGYSHEEEVLFNWKGEVIRATRIKHYPPDLAVVKFWMYNRQKEYWRAQRKREVAEHGNRLLMTEDDKRQKREVIDSILTLVKPKPDWPESDPPPFGSSEPSA